MSGAGKDRHRIPIDIGSMVFDLPIMLPIFKEFIIDESDKAKEDSIRPTRQGDGSNPASVQVKNAAIRDTPRMTVKKKAPVESAPGKSKVPKKMLVKEPPRTSKGYLDNHASTSQSTSLSNEEGQTEDDQLLMKVSDLEAKCIAMRGAIAIFSQLSLELDEEHVNLLAQYEEVVGSTNEG